MAFSTVGYWGATYNPINYWIENYWPDVIPTIGGGAVSYRKSDKEQREKREEKEILMFIKEFLRVQ